MPRNYNRILLIGIIETEMCLRSTSNNTPVTNFTLTTSNKWINKEGEEKTYKKWHHVVCWGKMAEYVTSNFKVGDTVVVDGSISYRYYEKNDKKIKVAEIKATSVSMWEGSLNRITLVGNIGSDLVLRKTTKDVSVTNFTISTIDRWKNKIGEIQFHKKWHRIVCWGKIAENAVKRIQNKSLVLIEGSISYKTYINKDGVKNNHIAEIKTTQLNKWANPRQYNSNLEDQNKERIEE